MGNRPVARTPSGEQASRIFMLSLHPSAITTREYSLMPDQTDIGYMWLYL
jgi:hypothetical protein